MKKCSKCGISKPIDDFYTLKHNSDGHFSECKECTKKRVRARESKLRENPQWVEAEKNRGREKYHRLYKGLKSKYSVRRKSSETYKIKYPEKQKAKEASYRKYCPKKHNRHHWSYRKEHYLDFIIVDEKFHYKIHRYLKYVPSKKIYRTLEGTLLDTRKKHEAFIELIKPLP